MREKIERKKFQREQNLKQNSNKFQKIDDGVCFWEILLGNFNLKWKWKRKNLKEKNRNRIEKLRKIEAKKMKKLEIQFNLIPFKWKKLQSKKITKKLKKKS